MQIQYGIQNAFIGKTCKTIATNFVSPQVLGIMLKREPTRLEFCSFKGNWYYSNLQGEISDTPKTVGKQWK